MFSGLSSSEKEEQIIENDIRLSFTEKRIWDMWGRWRTSEHTLYPWHYMTDGKVYADDIVDLESMERIANKLEDAQEALEQHKMNVSKKRSS